MKLVHIILAVLLSNSVFSEKPVKRKSKSLIHQIRKFTLDIFPEQLKNQRRLIKLLNHGNTAYQKSQVQAIHDAKIKAENELGVETQKRIELEEKYAVDKAEFEKTLVGLNDQLATLREQFDNLKDKSNQVHDEWFDESDDHTHATAFLNSYEDDFGSDNEVLKSKAVDQ